uniref:Zmp:0000000924 n=1 Tax=Cyprinus carpio TaxID=7962 RepID=A0A8C1UDS2_CYPCA
MSGPVYANVITDGTHKDRRNKRNQTPQHTGTNTHAGLFVEIKKHLSLCLCLSSSGSDSVKTRSSRAAVVCLVLLCVLLLAAVIVLGVHIHTNNTNYTRERDLLLTKITNLTEDRDDLQTKINGLTEDKDQLLTNSLTEERNELIIKNRNLLNERPHLKNELQLLCKEDEWIYYKSSFYYMSNERKSWTESRQDCLKKGADLIIINSSEEQDFVKSSTVKREFWIGVTDIDVEDIWKWVDGSTLTSGFWASKEPNGGTIENCAVTYSTQWPDLLGWLDVKCNDAYQWICEKSIWP